MVDVSALKNVVDRVTPIHLFLGLTGLSLVVMLISTCVMFSVSGPLPPPRDPPPRVDTSAVLSYRYKEGFFKALVTEDAQKLGVKRFSFKRLVAVNRHFIEFTGSQLLRPRGKLETRHLVLEAQRRKIFVGEPGHGYRIDHLVLVIVNKTGHHLAYRVVTTAKGECGRKGAMPHNALAIVPKGRVMRTECILAPGTEVRVREVEVMEVSPLGYYYISRLDPGHLQLPRRTTAGHEIPGGMQPCRLLPWRRIKAGMQRGDVAWSDVIDFYSRHNCDEYTFFTEYVYDRKGPGRLPAVPPKNQQAE